MAIKRNQGSDVIAAFVICNGCCILLRWNMIHKRDIESINAFMEDFKVVRSKTHTQLCGNGIPAKVFERESRAMLGN